VRCEKPDCDWPKCVGPNGCMNPPLPKPAPKPVVVTFPVVRVVRKAWKDPPKKPRRKPRLFPVEKRVYGPRPGRSISINGEIHGQLRNETIARGEKMAAVIEVEINHWLDENDK
jgi:hypothetical protein